jgi:hypothetical protein
MMAENDEERRDEREHDAKTPRKPTLEEQQSDEQRIRTGGSGVQQPERAVVDRNVRHGRKPHP